MSREAITIGRRHDTGEIVVISGKKALEYRDHIDEFKKLCSDREHKDFSSVEVWTSNSGRVKHRQFSKPAKKKAGEESDPEAPPVTHHKATSYQPTHRLTK